MIRALRLETRSTERAVLAVAALCALTGTAMAARPGVAPLVAATALLAALALDWRRGVVALLVVLPFAGLPVFIAGTPGLALRDVAVTVPLYAAFALAMTSGLKARAAEADGDDALPQLGVALPALAAFALLVLIGVARAPSFETGVIGAKVWLAYVPMLAIGYRYVRRIEDFEGALRLTALIGLVPASIALGEWLLATRRGIGAGDTWVNEFGPFARMYGAWFEHVKWSGVAFGPDGHSIMIPRVPSTFTGATQYFGFAMVAYAAGLAMALRRRTTGWALCALILGAAAMASGARAAYVAVPAITIASMALAGAAPRLWARLAVIAAVLTLASTFAGPAPWRVAMMLPAHAREQLATASNEMGGALTGAPLGHGTGWDTNSALRYGGSGQQRYIENWYAKTALELGIAGLVCIVVALASVGARLAAGWRRLDAGARQLAAPVLALLGIVAGALFKGPYVDLDPLNVYAWLLAGMLLGLYRCARAEAPPVPGRIGVGRGLKARATGTGEVAA